MPERIKNAGRSIHLGPRVWLRLRSGAELAEGCRRPSLQWRILTTTEEKSERVMTIYVYVYLRVLCSNPLEGNMTN